MRPWLSSATDVLVCCQLKSGSAAASTAARRWEPDQFPLLVLAMYHVFVGYFAIAHVYKDLNGQDLLTQQALDKQTRFFGDLVAALFEEESARPDL